ncbi:hypothetical protein PRBRB14_21360 [Hallella multisaccharivorax DSM 17128]|nr:hypothetical protein PRBRB14_21360 [Hallella multisaccharivorax DSM 17128]
MIVKDGKNYLVDDNGDIRSEGTSEQFQWDWESDKEFPYPAFILITNPALPNKWRVDIRTGVMTEI